MDDSGPVDHQSSFADEESIVRLIELAKQGGSMGVASGWLLIDNLERLFSERAAGEHDQLGLAFVQALAGTWNRAYDIANPPAGEGVPNGNVSGQNPKFHTQQLPRALKALGLVSARGRPKTGDDPMGQRAAAWIRLEEAATAFSQGGALEQWLAQFFHALLAVRDAKGPAVPAKDLLPAFDCLHLVKSKNRQPMDEVEVEVLLATEELVRQVLAASRKPARYLHGDAEAAREIAGQITTTDPARLAAVRKLHPEIARIVSPNADAGYEGSWLSVAELEGLAGIDWKAIEQAVAKSVK